MSWCLLIPIIVGVICAVLGYLLGGILHKGKDNNNSSPGMYAKSKHSSFDAVAAAAALRREVKENDLKIIEGIGPKIEKLFNKHGIFTWKALGDCSVEKCQEILNEGGMAYELHNPGTWPDQADLAYLGKWEVLSVWQDILLGGK